MERDSAFAVGTQATPEDIDAIARSSVDYIEAWYTGDGERIEGCLHPELAKRAVDSDPRTGARTLHHLDARTMVASTREGRGTKTPPADRTHQVSILDVFRNIACVKVVSHPYVDYLHLGKFNQRWLIVNVLWERRQP